MEEIWKDIEGYEGMYQVSNLGRVKSLARTTRANLGIRHIPEMILKPIVEEDFYCKVGLYDGNSKSKRHSVSRLVATHFIPNPNNYPNVLHKDEELPPDKAHAASNLWWGTQKQNRKDCIDKGRNVFVVGESHPGSKIKESDAIKIIDYIDQGLKIREILKLVPDSTKSIVDKIKAGTGWKHLRK